MNYAAPASFIRKITKTRTIALIVSVATLISIVFTYLTITGSDPLGPDPQNVIAFILTDLILLLTLAFIISRRFVKLIVERKKGSVGSRLQTRIVVMFSIVAIIPTIIMTVFSAIFLNYGIQSWFNQRVSAAIEGSVAIADAYLEEHKKIIKADVLGAASDLNRESYRLRKRSQRSFSQALSLLASIRKIPEAIVFQQNTGHKKTLAKTPISFALQLQMDELSPDLINRASSGELVIITSDSDDRVIALVKLQNYFDTYLLIGRFVDRNIINHIETTTEGANQYTRLKAEVSNLQIKFLIIFIIISLLLLLVVVWLGMIFANTLVHPISVLVSATEKVKAGILSTRVKEGHENDEIATLSRAFNRMIEQLERQRKELISAQRSAAWSDVARRIAHEIKNPLTPIHLAADRLKRKYADQVEDKETYNKYVETITRHVADIGKIVEEFANFARMPAPVFNNEDIIKIVEDVIFSREGINKNISYKVQKPENAVLINCDSSKLTQVFTNLLKNAEEAINEAGIKKGIINITMSANKTSCKIKIKDNGPGIPVDILEHVMEPYVTKKNKGTGLGLAIVKKIVEEHDGSIVCTNTNKGACILIEFPINKA